MGRVVDPGSGAPVIFSEAEDGPSVPGAGLAGGGAVAVVAGFRSWLVGVDWAGLTDRERVDLVAELERVKGAASAVQARATDDEASGV